HGPKLLGWIIDECEIVGIGYPVLLGVVAYDDGSASQMRAMSSSAGRAIGIQISTSAKSTGPSMCRSVSRRSPSRRSMKRVKPAPWKCARAALAFSGSCARPGRACLLGLVLRAGYHALAAGSTKVVAQGGSQINRRDAI